VDLIVQPEHRGHEVPTSLDALVQDGVLDAELAALVSILVEARVPVIVAGACDAAARERVLEAVLTALPADVDRIELAGPTEDFAWLPEAESLGWRHDGPTPGRDRHEPATPDRTVILAADLAPMDLGATWAGILRIAVRAVSLGYGLAATIEAGSLEAVLDRLGNAPFRLTADERSRLGLVLILGGGAGSGGPGVSAAHYIRPVARDQHGHVQALGPAVLAAWNEAAGAFDHFGWGVIPELALRTGRRAGDFEIELDTRREAFERGAA
jgi:hypothetical protein